MDQVLKLRNSLLNNGCTFRAVVTADYGQKIYTFTLDCKVDPQGNLSFTVVQPESIAGITGNVTQTGGELTFDDKVLAFEPLADGLVSPVSAPWLLIHTLRSGYLKSCGKDTEGLHIQIDDSYADNALQVDIWTNHQTIPKRGELLWQGKRILSMDIENFTVV